MSGKRILCSFLNEGAILSIVPYQRAGFRSALCLLERRSRYRSKYAFALGYLSREIRLPSGLYGLSRNFPPQRILLPCKSRAFIAGRSNSASTMLANSEEINILSAPVATPIPILKPCSSIKLRPSLFLTSLKAEDQSSPLGVTICRPVCVLSSETSSIFKYGNVGACELLLIRVIAGYASTSSLNASASSKSMIFSMRKERAIISRSNFP